MRKMTNSMWIRRVSPLTLAGALVLPLAVQSADVAQKAAVPSAAQKVTEKGKQDKQEFIDRCEKERMAALNLAAEGDYNNAVVRLEAVAKILKNTTGDLAAARRNAPHHRRRKPCDGRIKTAGGFILPLVFVW